MEQVVNQYSLNAFIFEKKSTLKVSKLLVAIVFFAFGKTVVLAQGGVRKMFVGTYTNTGSYGIYVYDFNENTGSATLLDSAKIDNPSYLAINKKGNRIYAVDENAGRNNPGAISAFSFNKKTNKFQFLNREKSGGDHPCFVAIDKNGRTVVAANYTGGSLSVFHTTKNGLLQPFSQNIQHYGKGPNKERQEKPHVHQAMFSPNEKYVFVNDLGLDETTLYPTRKKGKLKNLDTANKITIKSSAGSGPRHTAFHPSIPIFYVTKELSGEVAAYKLDGKTATLIQTISIDSIDTGADKGSADIHISPDGKFLYVSNRGKANNIAICQISQTGELKVIGFESVLGVQPRNFVISPNGDYLLVANQGTSNIVIFKRDKETGLLTPTGTQIMQKVPTCLIFE